jgi:hypothetical protein
MNTKLRVIAFAAIVGLVSSLMAAQAFAEHRAGRGRALRTVQHAGRRGVSLTRTNATRFLHSPARRGTQHGSMDFMRVAGTFLNGGQHGHSGPRGRTDALQRFGVGRNIDVRDVVNGLLTNGRHGSSASSALLRYLRTQGGYGSPHDGRAVDYPCLGWSGNTRDSWGRSYRDFGLQNAAASLASIAAGGAAWAYRAPAPAMCDPVRSVPGAHYETYEIWVPEVYDPHTGMKVAGGYFEVRTRLVPDAGPCPCVR